METWGAKSAHTKFIKVREPEQVNVPNKVAKGISAGLSVCRARISFVIRSALRYSKRPGVLGIHVCKYLHGCLYMIVTIANFTTASDVPCLNAEL